MQIRTPKEHLGKNFVKTQTKKEIDMISLKLQVTELFQDYKSKCT